MSHSHTHAPGEAHTHSHGPQPPAQPQQAPQMVPPPPDPVMQAIIDQSFHPVDLSIGGDVNSPSVLCAKHSVEKCTDCDLDFKELNRLSKVLFLNPNLLCPPPAKIVNQKLSQAVNVTKEEGNALFKAGQHEKALVKYTMAASLACSRAPWEAQQIMREELSAVISNRSAAYLESGDPISALVDAETVVQLKRNWSKGHFRKAKALVALGDLEGARDSIALGLAFEPNNTEMNQFMAEITASIQKAREAKLSAKSKLASS